MKMSEVTLEVAKSFMNVFYDEDDVLIEQVIMPSAKSYIASYTKRTLEDLDNIPEITTAFLILCTHLYDNRSLETTSKEINEYLRQSLSMHTFHRFG